MEEIIITSEAKVLRIACIPIQINRTTVMIRFIVERSSKRIFSNSTVFKYSTKSFPNLFQELQAQFKRLRKQAEVMQQYLDLHYTYLRDLSQRMKGAARTASRRLDNVDEVVTENNGEINFNLERIRISQRVRLLLPISLFWGTTQRRVHNFCKHLRWSFAKMINGFSH